MLDSDTTLLCTYPIMVLTITLFTSFRAIEYYILNPVYYPLFHASTIRMELETLVEVKFYPNLFRLVLFFAVRNGACSLDR